MDNNMEDSGNRNPCAACKYQRKKCLSDCILRKHFPANLADDFRAVQNVFSIATLKKMIEKSEVPEQEVVVKSIYWEARMWDQDPVHGPYGSYKKLKQELEELKREQRNDKYRRLQNMTQPPLPPRDNNNSLDWKVGNQELGGHSSCLPTINQGMLSAIQSRFLQPTQQSQGIGRNMGSSPFSYPSTRTGEWSGIHNIGSINPFAAPLIRDGSEDSQAINQDTETLQAICQQQYLQTMEHNAPLGNGNLQ
ncbi:unnamed protein product [Fraxinus pennsylvanica]|uniref:LOB domain-containing protein n=1 Tax=Fraxinus pennsylvanica TaxID=56036 RepID=A0AAD2EDD9_9LAMI|nr:unnamed protein product [Fraxinus pennsylvanica]